MKVFKKFKLIFLQILLSISLISLGYSSWLIDNAHTDFNFSGEVGNVIDLDSFLICDDFEMFKVSPYGIIKNEEIVFKGEIVFSLRIKIKDGVINIIEQKDNLELSFYLKNNGTFDLFNTALLGTNPLIYYSLGDQFYVYDFDNSINGTLLSGELFTNLTYINESLMNIDYLFCTLKYVFDFSMFSSNFEEEIFNKIDSSSFIINFKAGLNIHG